MSINDIFEMLDLFYANIHLKNKIRKDKDMKIKEVDKSIKVLVDANDGYCPCLVAKNEDTKCMCKDFREQTTPGKCHCGRFEKVEG